MATAEPKSSWFSRNWRWAVPAGCLVLVLAFVAVLALAIGGGLAAFGAAVRSSEVVAQATERARSDPRVVGVLGEPIEIGFLVTGSLDVSGPSGEAHLSLPLRGPKGSGTLFVEGEKKAGEWSLELLAFRPDGGDERVDLLAPPPAPPAG